MPITVYTNTGPTDADFVGLYDELPVSLGTRWFGGAAIQNSAAETTIASVTIPDNVFEKMALVNWRSWNSIANGSGANVTYTLRVYVNGTVVYADATGNIATGTQAAANYMDLTFANDADRNQIRTMGLIVTGGRGAVTTGTTGDLATASIIPTAPIIANPIVWGGGRDVEIRITVQLSSASPSYSFTNANNLITYTPV